MRLLASMGTHMDGESARLDEAFLASRPGAGVVSRAGVSVVMPHQIGFTAETLKNGGVSGGEG